MRAWIPWRSGEIVTSLAPEEVAAALATDIDPGGFDVGYELRSRPWIGTVDARGFTFHRRIEHGNPMLPRVRGTVEAEGAGARVRFTLRMHWSVMIFDAVWVTFTTTFAVIATYAMMSSSPSVFGLSVWGLPLFWLAMMRRFFGEEANIAERFLRERLAMPPSTSMSAYR